MICSVVVVRRFIDIPMLMYILIPSPYVDEAVKKGMDSERECKIRRSSTLSFENNYDAAIRDLMKEAEDWASKDK
jgi:hypothetical protein